MGLNGHDPDPGDWHPDDLAGSRVYPGADEADTTRAGSATGHGMGADGPPGAGGDGPVDAWRDLADIELSPPKPALHGIIAAEPGDLTLLHGEPGSGKGYLASFLAAKTIKGDGRVLIVDGEGHHKEWRRRLTMMLGGELKHDIVNIRGHLGGPLETEDYAAQADLLIVDSAGMFTADSEHDAWKETALSMQRAAQVANVPVVVIGHPSKSDAQMYGSIFWRAACRVSWNVTRQRLLCVKANDIGGVQEGHVLDVRYEQDALGNCTSYEIGTAADPVRTNAEVLRDAMGIDEHGVDVLMHALGWSRKKVLSALHDLGAESRVQATASGQPKKLWKLPTDGLI